MGMEIALVARRNIGREPDVFDGEYATTDHRAIMDMHGIDDTGSSDIVSLYYVSPEPKYIFKPDQYELVIRDARFARHRGRDAMRSVTNLNRPAWLDDDAMFAIENVAHQLLIAKLSCHGGRYKRIRWNEMVDFRGSTDTELPKIKVRHNTTIEDSAIERFAPGSVFCGNVNTSRSMLTGDGLRGVVCCEYGETFNCEGLRSLTFLPDDFHVTPRAGTPNLPAEYHIAVGSEYAQDGIILAAGSGLTWDSIPRRLWPQVHGLGKMPK